MDKQVFCLMGPTASGKTALACELVQRFPFEIISIDSAMVYRGMDIGTAKPEQAILKIAPHHLIDVIDPLDSYSAAKCANDVNHLCEKLISQGKIPLLVGGTMMYFHAIQQGLSLLPDANELVRKQLLQQAEALGWPYLHQQLREIDPISATRIHPADTQRIQRALEVFQLSGKPLSSLIAEQNRKQDVQFVNLLLMPSDRAWLHKRIEARFNQMMSKGLIDEVIQLTQQWPLTLALPSMRCVGYRQVFEYLQKKITKDVLIEKGVAATRQLAKRQLTWLRHWPTGYPFKVEDVTCFKEIVALIKQRL